MGLFVMSDVSTKWRKWVNGERGADYENIPLYFKSRTSWSDHIELYEFL